MVYMLIPYFVLYGLIIWIIYKRKTNIIINDLFWLIISWTAMLGIYLFSGISYFYVPGLKTWLYIVAFFCVYILGRSFGMRTKIDTSSGKKIRVNDNILLFLTVLGAVLRLYDIIRLNGFLSANRSDVHSSFMGIIGSFLSPLGLPLFLKIGFQAKSENRRIPIKAFFALILYVLPVIFLSGRLNLIFALIALICLLLYKPYTIDENVPTVRELLANKSGRGKRVAITAVIVAGVIAFLRYSNYIIGNRFKNFDTMLVISGLNDSFTLTENAKPFYDNFGAFGSLVFQVLNYYSAQFKNVALLVEQFHGPHSFGLVQLHYIARRSQFFQNIVQSTNDAVRAATVVGGRAFDGSGASWVTVVGDMVIDFGMIGGLFVIFIISMLIGRKRAVFLNAPNNSYELSIQVMLCVCMFFTVQLSPFFETSLVYAFIWMWVLSNFRLGKTQR